MAELRDQVTIARTRLTVEIIEDSEGHFAAKYAPVDDETGRPVPMRMSHVIGQIMQAAVFIMMESTKNIAADYSAKSQGPKAPEPEPEPPRSKAAKR